MTAPRVGVGQFDELPESVRPVPNNMGWNLLGHRHRAPTYNQNPISITGDELLDQDSACVRLASSQWIMCADSSIVLQIHAHTASVVTIERFEDDWIAYFASGSDGALLISYPDRLGNRQPCVAHQAIGQILVKSNVGREMALGRDVGSPNTPLVFTISELQQGTERSSSASELDALLAVIEALHRDVATLRFRDQCACARPVAERCR